MRKIESTNYENEIDLKESCDVSYTLSLIGGRWKAQILFEILNKRSSYSDLKKNIEGISDRMLSKQLNELSKDKLIQKSEDSLQKTEYSLTRLGESLEKLLHDISKWGKSARKTVSAP